MSPVTKTKVTAYSAGKSFESPHPPMCFGHKHEPADFEEDHGEWYSAGPDFRTPKHKSSCLWVGITAFFVLVGILFFTI